MTDVYDPIKPLPEECLCGGGRQPCPSTGPYWGSWVPAWAVLAVEQGQKLVMDQRTEFCAKAVAAYKKAHSPEQVIYRGLPAVFVSLSHEWDDPDKRSALLARMAAASPEQLVNYFSPHMDARWNIRLWLARFQAYLDALEKLALYNVVPEQESQSTASAFYRRF